MSAFVEFCLLAVALYLWESILWLPLRGVALRWSGIRSRWRVLLPDRWLVIRETGLIPMLPLWPDTGLAPCQGPPLVATANDELHMLTSEGRLISLGEVTWADISEHSNQLIVCGKSTRLTSVRWIGGLRRAKLRGTSPAAAVRQAWRLAISPSRAAREWRRWRLVSAPLGWLTPLLTYGFLVGLPLVYVTKGSSQSLLFALWLWCLMGMIAAQLWWLGRRVYPDARAALRMDAMLALVVPFHAMRAAEIAAVHAMATTHPVALLLSASDLTNPWLANFIRKLVHPSPGDSGDAIQTAEILPVLERVLARLGKVAADYDHPPDRSQDPDAAAYCPRCHGMYLEQVDSCPDCRGVKLRRFTGEC